MKTSHPSEQERELYASMPDVLSAERRSIIESHIRRCRRCREEITRLHSFFEDVHQRLSDSPKEIDRVIAQRLSIPQSPKSLPPWEGRLLTDTDAPIIRSSFGLMRYVKQNPLKTGGVVSLAAALVIAVAALLKTPADTNPAKAAVRNSVLYVYNSAGQLLWTKSARGLQDDSSKYNPLVDDLGSPSFVRVFDIDGDGRNEALVTLEPARAAGLLKPYDFAPDTLYCFNSDGSLRWKHGMSGGMRFGAVDFSKNPHWHIWKFLPVRRSSRERVQLFVLAYIRPSWASKLFELDPQTGKELQSYWHTGGMSSAVEADVDGDGIKELVVGGMNNHLRGAAIAVFDPRSVQGAGPTIPEMVPTEAGKGTEKYYLLLPRSSLGIALGTRTPYNSVTQIQVTTEGRVVIQTNETNRADYDAGLVYGFGDNMRINYVVANDPFEVNFEKARKQGLIKDELNAAYYENLRKSVRYWDGERFVNEPTMNKRYWSGRNLP
jgi:hypothetical protein